MSYTLGAGFSTGNLATNHDLSKEYRAKLKNVNPELTDSNVVLINNLQIEGGKVEKLDAYADRLMQPVVDAYNAKQRRQDRQVKGGYLEGYHYQNEHYTQGKEGKPEIWKEAVLSYGGHDNIGGEYFSKDTSPERKQEIYQEAVGFFDRSIKEIQKQYPHMHIAYAVVHADEPNGSIHCHVCFNFIAEYKQGLKQRICWSKGLEQDGIEAIRDKTLAQEMGGFQLTRFYAQVRQEIMNPMLQEMGYTIKQEEHGIVHQGVDRYKVDRDKAKEEADKIVQEAEERAIKINMTADKLKDVAQTKASDIINQAEKEKATAVNEAALIKQEAQKQSALIKQEAQQQSKQIIENANERAQEALSAAQSAEADKERAIEQKAEIEASAASLREEAQNLKQSIQEAQDIAAERVKKAEEALKVVQAEYDSAKAEFKQLKDDMDELNKYRLTQNQISQVKKDIEKAKKSATKKGRIWFGDEVVPVRLETLEGMYVKAAEYEKLDDINDALHKRERELHSRESSLESREQRVSDRERDVAAPEAELQARIEAEKAKALHLQESIYKNKAEQYDSVKKERDKYHDEIELYHAVTQKFEIGRGVTLDSVIKVIEQSKEPNSTLRELVNKAMQVCDYLKTGYDSLSSEIKALGEKAKSIAHHIHMGH